MAKIYNSDVTKGLSQDAGIQQSIEKVPNELAEKIVPVIETNPDLKRKITIIKSVDVSVTSAGTGPIYTTPANQDFYLCGASYVLIKDNLCDAVSSLKAITCVINGETISVIKVGTFTLTAQSENVLIDFNRPIKVDRNSQINYTNMTFAAGSCLRNMRIWGYIDDKSNA